MASPRLFADKDSSIAYYHCVSRVVDRRLVLLDEEREHFVRLMRAYESFCQVRIVSYCIMSNHFHLMVEVTKRPEGAVFTDAWLLKQARFIYSKTAVAMLKAHLESLRRQGDDRAAEELKAKYLSRMWNVSAFMKELKQRFSLWFNKRAERKGTLWEERFSSVLLEGELATLSVMSAYIDLNPVRAGLVEDPKDYRWCSYAEAVAGGKKALAGLFTITQEHRQHARARPGEAARRVPPVADADLLAGYRIWLFGQGEEVRSSHLSDSEILRKGFKNEKVEMVRAARGHLSLQEVLRCRVRYFTRGMALGSKSYLDGVFEINRPSFGTRRKRGAQPMRGGDFAGVFTLRAPTEGVVPSAALGPAAKAP